MNDIQIVVDTNVFFSFLKDTPFVALTLHLDGRLWTGDGELQTALRTKGFDRFFVFES